MYYPGGMYFRKYISDYPFLPIVLLMHHERVNYLVCAPAHQITSRRPPWGKGPAKKMPCNSDEPMTSTSRFWLS